MMAARVREARTKPPGWRTQGVLRQTGLAVLEYLLYHRLNPETGRCDPSILDIAKGCDMHPCTVIEALTRIEAQGFLARVQRRATVHVRGRPVEVQWRNAYGFKRPGPDSECPRQTTSKKKQEAREGRSVNPPSDLGVDLLAARRLAFQAQYARPLPPPLAAPAPPTWPRTGWKSPQG